MTPAVSVLLPTYNQAAFLPDALAGLDAQTFDDFELIACDDGSTDHTRDILVDGDCLTAIHTDNRGTAAAINTAAEFAMSDLLTWVSSDNVMHPDWLETLVGEMGPGVGAVYSAYERVDHGVMTFVPREERPGPYDPARLISGESCYLGPSFLIRREVWQEHRGGNSHDYDNWLRVEEACWAKGLSIRYVDKVLCTYRCHPGQTGARFPKKYDAGHWRSEAIKRRASTSVVVGHP